MTQQLLSILIGVVSIGGYLLVCGFAASFFPDAPKPPPAPSDRDVEAENLGRRWQYAAPDLGLALKRTDALGNPWTEVPALERVEFINADCRRLIFRLPPGITRDDFGKKAEALAGAFGMSDAEVERDTGRADLVAVLLIRPNSALTRDLPSELNPVLRMVPGASPLAPVSLGLLSSGDPLKLSLFEASWLVGGSPGSGKSVFVQQLLATAALTSNCELWLLDPKEVEFAFWEARATRLVRSPELADHIACLEELVAVMDARYAELRAAGKRKASIGPEMPLILLVIDELAELTASGDKKGNPVAGELIRRLVAKGRAAGICVVCATQKPSADVVPTSLRDLFGYRIAFRCGTNAQSDTILGNGQAQLGGDASRISTSTRGLGMVLGDGERMARRFKSFYLSDAELVAIAERATPDNLDARRAVVPIPCTAAHAVLPLFKTPADCPECAANRRHFFAGEGVACP
jgi:S-DNA-T family DNA segregation ATPase FtsK/SpoIIIE